MLVECKWSIAAIDLWIFVSNTPPPIDRMSGGHIVARISSLYFPHRLFELLSRVGVAPKYVDLPIST